MKNIAAFCDGTWNHLDMVEPTNVAILSRNVLPVTTAGQEQRAIYLPGVGTRKQAAGPIERAVDRLTGGAFGWGLDGRLEAAYREIAVIYEPGDRLFLFGFSRGAYMARSLAGLLRNCGLPEPATLGRIGEAMTLYRNREPGSHPDAPASLRFRAAFSPRFATSETDRMVRPNLAGIGAVETLSVDYLGVWDTVGALGVPDHFAGLAAITNGKYKFHDLRLSSMVKSARHAVAIDERRRTFPPTLWENLTELNIGEGDLPYRQEWFPGTHGGVGGGGPIRGLSNAALLWILGGAEEAGLEFSAAMKDAAQRAVAVDAPLDNHPPKSGPLAGLFKGKGVDRSPPPSIRAVSWMARERWRLHGYRPVPLRPFGPKMEPPVLPGEWRD